MNRKRKMSLLGGLSALVVFIVWTMAISFIDVQPIGPSGSSVGFATINGLFHKLTGTNMSLYVITDWLGLVPVLFGFGFAILGIVQWIKRKNILKVDFNILVLGGFYVVVLAAYILFEEIVINYRPVLIDGHLEVSYPSSTTLLVMCVMPTAIMQLNDRIKDPGVRSITSWLLIAFVAFMAVGRLVCGVHWFTDIAGGVLLSTGLVMLYRSITN